MKHLTPEVFKLDWFCYARRCSFDRNLLLRNENTNSASNDYFVCAPYCCVCSDPVTDLRSAFK